MYVGSLSNNRTDVPSNKRSVTGEIEVVGSECFLMKVGSMKQCVEPESTKADAGILAEKKKNAEVKRVYAKNWGQLRLRH